MPTPLADPPAVLYLVLALLAVVAGGLLARSQDRGSLVRFGLAVGLLVALFACDFLFESPREEAVRRVRAMAAALTARNQTAFLADVSDTFEYKGRKKADLQAAGWWAELRRLSVTASVSGFDRAKTVYLDLNGTPAVEIAFDGLASTPDGARLPRHFTARFVRDPDDAYRLRSFTPKNYINKTDEDPIPGL